MGKKLESNEDALKAIVSILGRDTVEEVEKAFAKVAYWGEPETLIYKNNVMLIWPTECRLYLNGRNKTSYNMSIDDGEYHPLLAAYYLARLVELH